MRKEKKPPKTRVVRARRYRFFQIGFVALALALAFVTYSNYNYYVFKILVGGNYIFSGDLDKLYDDILGPERPRGRMKSFDYAVMAAFTEKLRAANGDRYTYLYTPQGYRLSRDAEKSDALTARYEVLSEDTVYMFLPNISDGTKDFVMKNKAELAPYKNLILDLRENYGGLLADFYSVAELFVQKGDVLGHEEMRIGLLTHAVKSSGGHYFDFDRILILQNADTASAAEGLILALKQNLANVQTVGSTTFGKGIGQATLPLQGGFALKATVLLVSGPDGESIHRKGITADYPYDGDDVIGYAESLLE